MTTLLTRVVAPNGSWTYLDQRGRVSGLSFGWTYPGGPSSAECNLDVPADAHVPALTAGSRLSIHRGASEVWTGRVATVDRGAPWKIQADGLAGIATREPVTITGTVDAILDAAITNGLPWSRPLSVSGAVWSGGTSGAELGKTMLDEVLNTVLLAGGGRWVLSTAGVVSMVNDPGVPTLVIRADTCPPVTLNDYATEVTARYQSSSGVYLTVRVVNAAAAAKFGRVAQTIDLGYTVMTSGAATTLAQAYLDRVSPRMTIAGDFTVTPGQVTTGASGPVDLAFVRPGVMARVQLVSLVRDALLVPTTSIDLLVGATKFDVDSDLLTISPVSRALSPAQIMFGGSGGGLM